MKPMILFSIAWVLMITISVNCKPSKSQQSGASDDPKVSSADLPSENVRAAQPSVLSGSYLHMTCEIVTTLSQPAQNLEAIGCQFTNMDAQRKKGSLPGMSLSVQDLNGNQIEIAKIKAFDSDKYDDAFLIKKIFLGNMIISSENKEIQVEPFFFNFDKIRSMVEKIEAGQ